VDKHQQKKYTICDKYIIIKAYALSSLTGPAAASLDCLTWTAGSQPD